MATKIPQQISDVYGISRTPPPTYVSRPWLEEKLTRGLARGRHAVIYGGSKQGKTCLRKQCLGDTGALAVQCSGVDSRPGLYAAILSALGAFVSRSQRRSFDGRPMLSVDMAAGGGPPSGGEENGAGAAAGAAMDRRPLEIDPGDANDVARVLRTAGFDRPVVLEDFHYLPENVQKEVAVDLKALYENSGVRVVVIGVWPEPNRLVRYNGELAGRIVAIDAGEWREAELREVIERGEALLGVSFAPDVTDEILDACRGNVGLLQEICRELCEHAGGSGDGEVGQANRPIDAVGAVEEAVRRIASEQVGRYRKFIDVYSGIDQRSGT